MTSLSTLPTDILILVLRYLTVGELAVLARSCKVLKSAVAEYGWTGYLRCHPRPSWSLAKARSRWSSYAQARFNTLTDQAWAKGEFVATPLSPPWNGKLQPLLAANASRLVVAAGNSLYSYEFMESSSEGVSPSVRFEGSCSLDEPRDARRDITGLASASDVGGSDQTCFLGFVDGGLERVLLSSSARQDQRGQDGLTVVRSHENRYRYHEGDTIESLSCSDNLLLSLSAGGRAALIDVHSASHTPQIVELDARSWASYLCTRASTPYAAFGTSSATPLAIHHVTGAGLSPQPAAVLTPNPDVLEDDASRSLAVYAITASPPSAPWGASDQIVVSGWYDGVVRVYDLRAPTLRHGGDAARPPSLGTVLWMYDPWSFEPIYTVSCGGGSASHIAAGSARHSVVSFWDVRAPARGFSVHAPGNDSSPVYATLLESSRLFGATQSRAFVYDFGPGVQQHSYPTIPRARNDGLKHKNNSVGFYVTKYNHSRTQESH